MRLLSDYSIEVPLHPKKDAYLNPLDVWSLFSWYLKRIFVFVLKWFRLLAKLCNDQMKSKNFFRSWRNAAKCISHENVGMYMLGNKSIENNTWKWKKKERKKNQINNNKKIYIPEVITDNAEGAFPTAIRKMVMPPIPLIMIPWRLIRAAMIAMFPFGQLWLQGRSSRDRAVDTRAGGSRVRGRDRCIITELTCSYAQKITRRRVSLFRHIRFTHFPLLQSQPAVSFRRIFFYT